MNNIITMFRALWKNEVFISLGCIVLHMSAALFYTQLEGWTVMDSMYFSVVTFTTVGYGQLTPASQKGRFFSIFYLLFGVMIIGKILTTISDRITSARVKAIDKRQSESERGLISCYVRRSKAYRSRKTSFDDKEINAGVDKFFPSCKELLKRSTLFITEMILLMVASYVYLNAYTDGASVIDIFYFTLVTISTVGYGDVVPKRDEAKLAFIFLLPLSVYSFVSFVTILDSWLTERKCGRKLREMYKNGVIIKEMDIDHDGKVNLCDFIEFMLVSMNKVEQNLLIDLRTMFNELDRDRNGYLDYNELKNILQSHSDTVSEISDNAENV